METARNIKLSPLHERLRAAGAYFRDVSGWEGADWYAPPGTAAEVEQLSWGRQNWFPFWQAEHEAVRDGVAIMDMSFMSKFAVAGPDAGALLDSISANSVNGPEGVITYTQWLNDRGTIEADLTVTKLSDDRFWVVASDTAHRHVAAWMSRHGDGMAVSITDVTTDYAQINVQGPRSRALLSAVTKTDLSDAAFPFRTAREVRIGDAAVLCVRITYLGELGYELFVAADEAVRVYDVIVRAGRAHGLRHAGLKALSSLRMEKAYRDYGHDIDNTDNLVEAGLGFAADLDNPVAFIGRSHHEAAMASRPATRRLVQVLLTDPAPLMYHGEIVYRNDVAVGYIRAASYGFTLGGAVGLAMIEPGRAVDSAYLEPARWEVDIAGSRYPAEVSLRPMYDPRSERIRL
jgi:4-methylaminobutanoate oxidase (formaldehyde-forming)